MYKVKAFCIKVVPGIRDVSWWGGGHLVYWIVLYFCKYGM